MFKTFTWAQYAGLVFVLLAVYYLFVAAVYYRVEIQQMLKGGAGPGPGPTPSVAVTARPSLVGGSGSLIPKSALVIQPEATDEEAAENEAQGAQGKESEDDEAILDEVKIEEPAIDDIASAEHEEDIDALPGPQQTDSEADFTVGVAQLSDYFEGAAEGSVTQEELVAQMPELDNTALLVAFFQSNTKAAQQLTSQYYVDVPEPVLD